MKKKKLSMSICGYIRDQVDINDVKIIDNFEALRFTVLTRHRSSLMIFGHISDSAKIKLLGAFFPLLFFNILNFLHILEENKQEIRSVENSVQITVEIKINKNKN